VDNESVDFRVARLYIYIYIYMYVWGGERKREREREYLSVQWCVKEKLVV
jgi:hypothetical protein